MLRTPGNLNEPTVALFFGLSNEGFLILFPLKSAYTSAVAVLLLLILVVYIILKKNLHFHSFTTLHITKVQYCNITKVALLFGCHQRLWRSRVREQALMQKHKVWGGERMVAMCWPCHFRAPAEESVPSAVPLLALVRAKKSAAVNRRDKD